MGSSSSKSIDPEQPTTVVTSSSRRSISRNVFQTACIRSPSDTSDNDIDDNDDDDVIQVSDHRVKDNGIEHNRSNVSTSKKSKGNKMKRADKRASRHSETQIGEWGESSLSGSVSRTGSGSSRNRSSRFLSRFNLIPGNTSSRSSRAYPDSSTSSVISNDDVLSSRSGNRSKTRQGCDIFPACFMTTSPVPQDDDGSDSDNSDLSSIHDLGRDGNINGIESNRNRRMEAREPVEQNVRFSRTLSVGRLRDRVLHRPTFPELASFPFPQEREVVSSGDGGETASRLSNESVTIPATSSNYSSSTTSNSLYGNHDFDIENMASRDNRFANLLEHRSNFLERRRRIRSQVHALQRMGSRFENLSGHERSCILSGQHRTGHCTCRLNNQDPIDGANARGSISRIVLLAEALFEVLDEIHQQSVVSSSRPALSSIGSVPAPVEVVEALPVKLYRKLPKQSYEDDTQCYICLVEYEDGDEVRVLPCHHEFHRLCVDKWLKEIHRICPLCRGDVCKTASLLTES